MSGMTNTEIDSAVGRTPEPGEPTDPRYPVTPKEFKLILDMALRNYKDFDWADSSEPFMAFILESVGLNPGLIPINNSVGWTAYASFVRLENGSFAPEDNPRLPEVGISLKRVLSHWTPEQAKIIHAVWNLIPAKFKL